MLQEVGGLFEEAEEDIELKESWTSVVHEVEKVVSSSSFVFDSRDASLTFSLPPSSQALSSIPKPSRKNFASSITSTVTAELLRTQTILYPLLPPPPPFDPTSSSQPPSASALTRRQSTMDGGKADMDARHLTLLRLGVPMVTSSTSSSTAELQSSLATVSPSQRFGLLSVAVSAR